MQTRREFLGALGMPILASATGSPAAPAPGEPAERQLERLVARASRLVDPVAAASDEDFWTEVARAFTVDRSLVNLNNGGVSPSPRLVQDAMKRHLDYSNDCPTYTMWRILRPQLEGVRQRLAREFGCDTEELALTRNASESLQICQFGFDLRRDDEVLCTNQDYPRMIDAFEQRARREGVVLRKISIPTPCEDPDEIVARYRDAITERTRLILVCHVVNLTGQILPVARIAALGRERGIPVVVDGAHALAHLDFRIRDLDVDYYAASLHKWLFAPHGTGMLYVRRECIHDLWPLMAPPPEDVDDIRKFEEIGTFPVANGLAVAEALTFHQGIGPARKLARLLHLRDHWAKRAITHPRVRLHTSLAPGCASSIATVEISEVDSTALSAWLLSEHRIVTTVIRHEEFSGVRVSPSVYTTREELDRFGDALSHVAEHGLPG